jgi:L-alanine-DL-glutamate epimerase-like enolase superfamily enzyme
MCLNIAAQRDFYVGTRADVTRPIKADSKLSLRWSVSAPMPPGGHSRQAKLRRALQTPILADECVMSPEDALRVVTEEAADRELPHHVAASLANATYAADIFVGGHKHHSDLILENWDEAGMTIRVPDQPGLGVTLRPEYASSPAT